MNIDQIKQWLNESEHEAALRQSEEPPTWPVTTDYLAQALVSVGIEADTAKAMFTSADPSLRILHELTNGYEDTQLVIRGDKAAIAPWNNADEYNWRGYFEGGNTNLALVLLVLCAKCYPLPDNAWGEGRWFYVNAEWQQEKHGVSY